MSSVRIYCLLSVLLYFGGVAKSSKIRDGSSLARTTTYELSNRARDRSATIEITNTMDVNLIGGEFYLCHGQNSIRPIKTIQPLHREAAVFAEHRGSTMGVAGVMTYTIDDESPKRFALVFSVPFNYIDACNWFGIKWVDSDSTVNRAFYVSMYNEWKNPGVYMNRKYGCAKQGQQLLITETTETKTVYTVNATMGTTGRSIIKLEVSRQVPSEDNYITDLEN